MHRLVSYRNYLAPGLYFLLAILLIWKTLAFGISGYLLDRDSLDTQDHQSALQWNPEHPDALFQLSQQQSHAYPQAKQQIADALITAPSLAHMLLPLAQHWLNNNELQRADKAAELAAQLMPAETAVHLQAAAHWLARNNIQKAIAHWSIVLAANTRNDKQLFPVFFQLLNSEQGRETLLTLAGSDPRWWPRFFSYVERKEKQIQKIDLLIGISQQSGRELTISERSQYINRLKREKNWGKAYFAWLNALNNEQKKFLGQLYNGGFEQTFQNTGFSWFSQATESAAVDTLHTYGVNGESALRIVFRNKPERFSHLHQPLYLSPGEHRLRGRVRKDSIRSTYGVQWQVHCISDKRKQLGESERFLGVDQWKNFSFDFQVPDHGCEAQELRLFSLGKRKDDFRVNGVLWFDDMRIRKMN